MSNWTLVGEVGFAVAAGVGHTEPLPGSPAENDIVIAATSWKNLINETPANASGYTKLGIGLVQYKVMGSTPDSDITVGAIPVKQAWVVQVWRPTIPSATVIDGQNFAQSTSAGGMPNPPAHTVSTNGSLRIISGHLRRDDVESSVTAPSGFGNLLAQDTEQASTTVGATAMLASYQDDDGGSENPAAFGGSGNDWWAAWHFSLRIGGNVAETDTILIADAVDYSVERVTGGTITAQSTLVGTLDVGFVQTFVRHNVSQSLVPKSTRDDSTEDGVFAQLVRDPIDESNYEGQEIDLGADLVVRVWADIELVAAPEGGSLPDLNLFLDWRKDADDYQGWRPWTIGLLEARYIKSRVLINNTSGLASFAEFTLNVDAQERTERHTDFVVEIGGTTLTYDTPFSTTPHIEAHPDGDNRFVFRTGKTTSQVTLVVRDESDADVGGTVDVTITGV